ncbi:MAG: HlyD family secretion protein [Nitrospiraceae bacterium]|nr:HlyD family secretion protein [Nitrospiraceae bacterium]
MDEMNVVSNNDKRKKTALVVFGVLVIVSSISLAIYLPYKESHISTDDAFITGRIHTISAKVSGTVKIVYVNDNQFVKKGDMLLEIDTQDYDVKVKEASSAFDAEKTRLSELKYKLETAKQQYEELKAVLGSAKANLELQEANMKQSESDMKRAEELFKEELISKERYEKTKTSYDIANAQLKASREELKQIESRLLTQKAVIKQTAAALEPQKSTIKQKEAQFDASKLNQGYTKIYAPADGNVTKKSLEAGNQVQAGQPLMAVVPLDDIWVIANYKETQLKKVKSGQRVKIKVDTYSGKTFEGTVDSIMAGTGAVFSLFPPENATGNYVKVVQRIPVKIAFDKGTDPGHVLRVGMSVVTTIIIDK